MRGTGAVRLPLQTLGNGRQVGTVVILGGAYFVAPKLGLKLVYHPSARVIRPKSLLPEPGGVGSPCLVRYRLGSAVWHSHSRPWDGLRRRLCKSHGISWTWLHSDLSCGATDVIDRDRSADSPVNEVDYQDIPGPLARHVDGPVVGANRYPVGRHTHVHGHADDIPSWVNDD